MTSDQTTQIDSPPNEGDVTSVVAAAGALLSSLPVARVRDGETRKQTWERLRREARTHGMNRKESVVYAGAAVKQLYPDEPTPPAAEPEIPPPASPQADSTGVSGLGDIPPDWPALPPNASLQSEIAWVQASRLDVVRETPQGAVVDLARADTPAPSKAAIGWLETSIRAYSKYCDIAARATQTQEHEAEQVRRERLSIEEVRALLEEMRRPSAG